MHAVHRAACTARPSTSSPTRWRGPHPPARRTWPAEWGAVASLSPELFLRRCGEEVTSSPIKGTLPRHMHPSALRASVKDVAENIMIVDLVRNDLGRVAVTGTVTVPELLAVRPAPGVWHLVSTVTAQVDVDVPMAAVLDAAFPPASVTGTPEDAGPPAAARLGAASPRGVLRHSRFGLTQSQAVNSTWRSGPSSSAPTDRPCSEWAAASPPTPTPTANGRSACIRRRRSSRLRAQPRRLTDHHIVAGVVGIRVCTPPRRAYQPSGPSSV